MLLSLPGLCAAVVKTSAGSGLWTNAATWSPSGVPACGDSVIIQSGHTVSLTAVDYDPCASKMTLVLKGTLKFTAAGKLELDCQGTIYVFSGGQIVAFNGATGNANAVMQCNSTWWNAGAGTYNGPGCIPPTRLGCGSVLPVELIAFSGTSCGSSEVCLNWSTLTERNHAFFDVQKLDEANEWQTLERFRSLEKDSRSRKDYSYTDRSPAHGLNYYQLRQVDIDGRSALSQIVVVDVKTLPVQEKYQVLPHPNNGRFTLVAAQPFEAGALVIICNSMGQLVSCDAAASGTTRLAIERTLPAGLYSCRILNGANSHNLPLIIE